MRNCSCPLLKRILDFSVAGAGSICPHIRFRMQFNYVTFLASFEILQLLFDIRTEPFLAAAQRHALTMLWLVLVLVVVVVLVLVQTFAFFDIGTSFIGNW